LCLLLAHEHALNKNFHQAKNKQTRASWRYLPARRGKNFAPLVVEKKRAATQKQGSLIKKKKTLAFLIKSIKCALSFNTKLADGNLISLWNSAGFDTQCS